MGPLFFHSCDETDVGVDHYGYNPDDIIVLMDRDDLAEDLKPTKDNIVCLLFFFSPFFVLMRGMVDDKDGRTSGGCTFWG